MKAIVFIGSNKSGSSREAIKAAEKLGFFTILFTNNEKFLNQRTEFPDVHQMILTDLNDMDSLKNNLYTLGSEGIRIHGILSFVDSHVYTAALLSKEFGLGNMSIEIIEVMNNKLLTRDKLKKLSVTPFYLRYTKDEEAEEFIKNKDIPFPVVAKSPLSTGSKDVLFIKNKEQLTRALEKMSSKDKILIEEYLEGPQYLIEVLVHKGNIHIVAVIEQQITYFKRFIVTGYAVLAEVETIFIESLRESIEMILDEFKLENGACHFEMRFVNGNWKLIEINPRISGGAMNRMIEAAFGINLVEETIQVYLGNDPDLQRKHTKYVYTHFLTVNQKGSLVKVTGRNRCSKHPGVEEVFIKPRKGKLLHPPKSMGDRYGYVMASASTKDEAKKTAIEAAKEIRFYLEPI